MARQTELMNYLDRNGVPYQLLSHVPAFRAHDVALVTHVPDIQSAKTLLVKAGSLYWMVVIPADYRLDEKLLKDLLEVHHIHLAREEDLEHLFPDCEVGAMPPFGNLYGLPVVVDSTLAEDEFIVFNACTHTESVRMRYTDYERLVHPMVAHIAVPTHHAEEERARS